MPHLEKLKETVMSHLLETAVAAVTMLIAWTFSTIGPAVAPAILAAIPIQAVLPLLLLSLLINLILVALIYLTTRKQEFRLQYGIYWDAYKNPHCPACKKPVAYNEYVNSGWGYYCQPCQHVYPLADAFGKQVKPEQVLTELA